MADSFFSEFLKAAAMRRELLAMKNFDGLQIFGNPVMSKTLVTLSEILPKNAKICNVPLAKYLKLASEAKSLNDFPKEQAALRACATEIGLRGIETPYSSESSNNLFKSHETKDEDKNTPMSLSGKILLGIIKLVMVGICVIALLLALLLYDSKKIDNLFGLVVSVLIFSSLFFLRVRWLTVAVLLSVAIFFTSCTRNIF